MVMTGQSEARGLKGLFSVQLKTLKYTCVSLSGDDSLLYKFWIIFCFLTMSVWIFFVIMEILKNLNDFNTTLPSLFYGTGIALGTSKFLIMYANREQLSSTLKLFEQEVILPKRRRCGPKEENLVKKCVDIGRIQVIVGVSFGIITVTLIMVNCFVKKLLTDDYTEWELPIKFTTINTTYSPVYELVLLSQSMALYFACTMFISIDIFISNILLHISVQCKILQTVIENAIEESFLKIAKETVEEHSLDPPQIPWIYLKSILAEIVTYHSAIINVAAQLEKVFTKLMLVEHVLILLILCFVMYNASLYPLTDSHFIQGFIIEFTILIEICALGYWGTDVIAESELVGNACYQMNFVGTDVRFQRGLTLVIQRSQRPITFTIGKFADLAVTTSFAMIKLAVSYFMVLRNTQTK